MIIGGETSGVHWERTRPHLGSRIVNRNWRIQTGWEQKTLSPTGGTGIFGVGWESVQAVCLKRGGCLQKAAGVGKEKGTAKPAHRGI